MSLGTFKSYIFTTLTVLLAICFTSPVIAETMFKVAKRPSRMDRLKQRTEKFTKSQAAKKQKDAATNKEIQAKWEKDNPELAAKLKIFLNGKAPSINYKDIGDSKHSKKYKFEFSTIMMRYGNISPGEHIFSANLVES